MKVALITLGCPKNLVDAEVMLGLIDRAGHSLVADPRGADVAIVNTCSFVSAAVSESRSVVEDCLALKAAGLLGRVVVAGCLPQRYGKDTRRILPGVDAVVGSSAFQEIDRVLEALGAGRQVTRVKRPTSLYDHRSPRILGTPPHLAYVKIADGCDNRCSYCTIPSIRGAFRSRRPDSVIAEARDLAEAGVKEVSLIAQDTTAYGTDIADPQGLPGLLRRLSDVGIPWIRLLYTHPARITDELLSVMASEDAVVPYLDVPVQHVSDRILAAMGRRIDGDAIRGLLERVRAVIPGVTIRSSVMTGFPGESAREFEELLGFVREGHVDFLGIFEFSPEPGTDAAELPDHVSGEIASERAHRIAEAAAEHAAARGAGMVGHEIRVLADDGDSGHTAGQAWETDGRVLWQQGGAGVPLPGTFVGAKVTAARGFDLVATPVAGAVSRAVSGETA
jgi:ribosomal protein S12 methylthiotransferase